MYSSSFTQARGIASVETRITVEEVYSRLDAVVTMYKETMDAVARQTNPTFLNTIMPIATCYNKSDYYLQSAAQSSFNPDKKVREASEKTGQLYTECLLDCSRRIDVYKAVRYVFDDSAEMASLSGEDQRLVEVIERKFRHNGLLISSDKRAELERVQKELVDVETKHCGNMTKDVPGVLFTREELAGVHNVYLRDMAAVVEDGVEKLSVGMGIDSYDTIMRQATHEETRKRMFIASGQRCMECIPAVQKVLELRLQVANLLGYRSHAEYMFEEQMAESAEEVLGSIDKIRQAIIGDAKKEFELIKEAKRKDMVAQGKPYEGFYDWDYRYYLWSVTDTPPESVEDKISEYLPVFDVGNRILDLFEKLLGLRISPVDERNVWHEDVEMFEVWEEDESEFVGHLYLDLHPREGKPDYLTSQLLRYGFERSDGTREYPAMVLLGNFSKPTETRPTLLSIEQLGALFVRFGNIFQGLCTRVKWVDLYRAEQDFMNAPPQLMGHWPAQPSVLDMLGSHHLTGAPIPEELVEKLNCKAEPSIYCGILSNMLHDAHDLLIHSATDSSIDIKQVFEELRSREFFLDNGDTGVYTILTLLHLVSDYDVRMYSYMFSDVHAADMYSRFKKEGLYNRQTGIAFRKEILAPGGSRSARVSLERFLGRKPNSIEYYKELIK
ncbi:metalloendopeptidase [Coemansia sp. RSA 552]|nr:metalloendopeptidase [Coemansia sp. RSA 552]